MMGIIFDFIHGTTFAVQLFQIDLFQKVVPIHGQKETFLFTLFAER